MASNDWKNRQRELLIRVRDVCNKENIKMLLCGESALAVYRDFSLNDYITIAIHAYDVNKFIKAVESLGEDIAIESMLTNNKYPTFDLRVCDLNTTNFNPNNYYSIDNQCLHIKVKLIETIPAVEVRFRALKSKYKSYSTAVKDNPQSVDVNVAPKLFKRMIKCVSSKPNYDKSFCKIMGNKFPAKVFETAKFIKIDGEDFPIPGEIEAYLEIEFGLTWRFHECVEYHEKPGFFRTTAFSWEEYKKTINDVDFEKYHKIRKEYKNISKMFDREHNKVLYCYNILERTYDRIYLWQKYTPIKKDIEKLYEEKKFDDLKDVLEEYYMFLDKHEKRNLGICFDREILDITMDVLRHDGHGEYAERLYRLVPQKHFEEIKLRDYKGEIIK